MTNFSDNEVAQIIFEKTGIIQNKGLLVEIIENEIRIEMMDRFDLVKLQPVDVYSSIKYGEEANTCFDLFCAGKIQTRFYKSITSEQRSYIRGLTANESIFFNICRTDNLIQKWAINFNFSHKQRNVFGIPNLSAKIIIGIREPYALKFV
jgi:hypothetical protein